MELIDNTLREGEQTPGVAFQVDEKLDLIRALVEAGIRRFDAAFPDADRLEGEFLERARLACPEAVLGASCRLLRASLEHARDVGAHEAFVVVPMSEMHLARRLHLAPAELPARLDAELGGGGPLRLNVVLEDAFRADPGFVERMARHVAGMGVDKVFLADTVGCMLPWQVALLVQRVRAALPATVGLGTHFHNDLGLALANTLAAVDAGATFVTAAVNGLGERAGNTDLLLAAVAAERLLGCSTGVVAARLVEVSRQVARLTGIIPPANAPLVGENAFRHTSGIHVHGVLADQRTYEAVPPALLGRTSELVLGRLSGHHHVRHLLALHGRPAAPEAEVEAALERVKAASLDPARRERAAALAEAVWAFGAGLGVRPEAVLDEGE